VAIVRALVARGWRPLAPSLDVPYGVGETHRFARGGEVLRLDVVTGPGFGSLGGRGLEAVVAAREWPGDALAGEPARLRLERADGPAWRAALDVWVERVESDAGG
jgi:hypothetical protein